MSKVVKILRTLRNNWKKSTFLGILGYYGVDYARNWHNNYMMMREYSKEALIFGQRPLPAGAKNKHITVFLNPTAGNRKSKTNLEKYSEPLLHLAGFFVNIVRTERIDEARDLAKIIEKTNIIVAAGGDGTLLETVTGLLRREDAEDAVKRYPIAVVPLGYHNQFAQRIFGRKVEGVDPKFIAEVTMAIVNHKIKAQDVMEVKIADDDDSDGDTELEVKKPKKPYYSLAGIALGQFREAQKILDELPSIFPSYFATFLSLYRTPSQFFKAEVRYVPVCEGCVKCIQTEPTKTESIPASNVFERSNQSSIWSRILSIFQPVHAQEISIGNPEEINHNNDSNYVNPLCGSWTSFCVDTSELNIKVCGNGRLQIEINKRFDKTDFMIEGLKRLRNEGGTFTKIIECQEAEIIPVEGQDFMSIDNEEFEMKHIKAKCLKDKVYFFVPS